MFEITICQMICISVFISAFYILHFIANVQLVRAYSKINKDFFTLPNTLYSIARSLHNSHIPFDLSIKLFLYLSDSYKLLYDDDIFKSLF